MRPYASLLSARARMLLQYRAAAWAGTGTRLFWGIIRLMIFEAFYRSSTAEQPISLPEVVTYIWLGQAFLTLIPFTSASPNPRTSSGLSMLESCPFRRPKWRSLIVMMARWDMTCSSVAALQGILRGVLVS